MWENTLAFVDDISYFGELATRWFEVSRPPGPPQGDSFSNDIITRAALQTYDREGHDLMRSLFTQSFHVPGCVHRHKHCPPSVRDVDGNDYRFQILEDTCWLAQNLKVRRLADTTALPNITDDAAWADNDIAAPAFSSYDNIAVSDVADDGLLYNHAAVVAAAKLCPENTRMPRTSDFNDMILFVDSASTVRAAPQLRAVGAWTVEAKDTHGFSALPSGVRGADGVFVGQGERTTFWTTDDNATDGESFTISAGSVNADRAFLSKKNGFSVRCLRDADDNFPSP